MLPIIYAAAILSALALGGMLALRSVGNVAVRGIVFVLLCALVLRVSFWLSARWSLDAVEMGIAWAVVLVLVIAVEVITRVRRNAGAQGA